MRKFGWAPAAARLARSEYEAFAEVVDPVQVPHVCRDPDDDHVLAAAVEGRAQWVVSGDNDLLSIGSHCGVEIITPAQLLDRLGGG